MINEEKSNIITIAVVVAVIAVGIGAGLSAGFFMASSGQSSSPHTSSSTSATPYSLTLVVTTNNQFSPSIGDQPAFFVIQNGTLASSANISIPANRLIELTIINYDDGNASVSSIYTSVTGTLSGKETVYNNTNINSTDGTGQIALNGSTQLSSVPVSVIAHTFTILNDGKVILNIPIVVSSIVQASFILQPGTYSWQCEAACGSGNAGWQGAMDTPGWMAGAVTAY